MLRIPTTSTLLAALYFTAGVATAQSPPAAAITATSDVLTCWYDENGAFTGSAPAPAGTTAGSKVQVGSSGKHTWSYTVAGHDSSACPAKLPVSTAAHQE
jgi:hypothetical protein